MSEDRIQGWKKASKGRGESLKEGCHRGGETSDLHVRSPHILIPSKICMVRAYPMGAREKKQQLEVEGTEWRFQFLL